MELKDLKGLGPTRLEALRAMGICSLRDLLYNLPVSYQDGTHCAPCALAVGETAVQGVLRAEPKLSRFNGLTKITAIRGMKAEICRWCGTISRGSANSFTAAKSTCCMVGSRRKMVSVS